MNKLFAVGYIPGNCMLFDVFQNLPVSNFGSIALPAGMGSIAQNSVNATMFVRTNADKSKLIVGGTQATTPGYFFVCPDTSDLSTTVKPTASFSGAVRCGDCSDTHYAVGGSGSLLYVYDWATHTLQSVATTGLGSVAAMQFTADGSYLYVAHGTAPYLRRYDTSDWSYVNAGANTTGSGNAHHIGLNKDETSVIVVNNSAPNFATFTPDLATRTYTFSGTQRQAGHWGTILPHPDTADKVIVANGAVGTTPVRLYEFNLNTSTFTDIVAGGLQSCSGAAIDPDSGILYVASTGASTHLVGGVEASFIAYDIRDNYAVLPYSVDPILALGAAASPSSICLALALLKRNTAKVTGTVRDINNDPAERVVRAYKRSTGQLVAQTLSDDTTGEYELLLPDDDVVDVQFMADGSESLNDLFFAKAIPEPV